MVGLDFTGEGGLIDRLIDRERSTKMGRRSKNRRGRLFPGTIVRDTLCD